MYHTHTASNTHYQARKHRKTRKLSSQVLPVHITALYKKKDKSNPEKRADKEKEKKKKTYQKKRKKREKKIERKCNG